MRRYLRYLEVNYDHEIPKDNDNPYPEVPGSVMHIAPPAGYGSGCTDLRSLGAPELPKYRQPSDFAFHIKVSVGEVSESADILEILWKIMKIVSTIIVKLYA